MKRIIVLCISFLLAVGSMGLCASAEGAEQTKVSVTISDENGKLVLIREEITVTDTDGDSLLTISDALYLAHEAKYEGGAAAGYSAEQTSFGLSLMKLWGAENGGSYGYFHNNASPMSLLDEIKNGDSVTAFVYTDLTAWSDQFCYFDKATVSADAGENITLVLKMPTFDENWNPITKPVEGAVITLNGEKTVFKTDAEGKVTFTVGKGGKYTVSAVSDTLTLVSPVCLAEIKAKQENIESEPKEPVKEENKKPSSPKTGDDMAVVLFVMGITAAACVAVNKKIHE